MPIFRKISRRRTLTSAAGFAGVSLMPRWVSAAAGPSAHRRPIPSSGEAVPVVGMGSWITFNVGRDETLRAKRLEVLRTFFDLGGGMVDSSPMYGSSEEVIGWCLGRLDGTPPLFSATKVWTSGRAQGVSEMETSRNLWGLEKFDLMQVHNLLDWNVHLETLFAMKRDGRLRYVGVTTSHGRRHRDLARIMETRPLDFVQLTYNVLDREAEEVLLPLAAERGIAVIANRPFRRGALFDHVGSVPLPTWSTEIDCANWAQVFLKFILSHPAVTCAIPATSRVDHMRENMGGGHGRLPDPELRARMVREIEAL